MPNHDMLVCSLGAGTYVIRGNRIPLAAGRKHVILVPRAGPRLMSSTSKAGSVIGVSDHGGWAIFVAIARDGTLLDRRRIELVDENLPSIPHHHEAQLLPIAEGVALVERVRASAEKRASRALGEIAAAVPNIMGIALRNCPRLPPTIAERITNYRARNVADWVMYRKALASAAETRGWRVYWYEPKTVLASAPEVQQRRKIVGAPWNTDHKLAMASAIACASALSEAAHRSAPTRLH